MSVTSGFFNSLNHDRRYNAQQFSALFDGIINDGVFANIGAAFAIKADTGVTVTVDKGKAWFNSAWVYNDAILPLTFEASEVVLDRIDAVVIEVDHSEAVRLGDIKIVKGTPSSNPQRPAMANTDNKHQHPLAYIYRKAGSNVITQADITNMVGTSSCPYITGILQVQNIDNIVAQWEGQWNQWYAEQVSEAGSATSELTAAMKSDFDIWFADVKALLDDDVATELAGKVADLQGKFDDLAREGAVYDTLEDFELDVILGSDGTPIQGKTVFGGGVDGPVDAITLQGHTPDDFRKSDWMPTAEEVGARPANWMPTAADVQAAPAGYGLGTNPGRYCADCYEVGNGGLYYCDSQTVHKPSGVTGGGSLFVQPISTPNGTDIYVTFKAGANIANRYYSSWAGYWQPWEWVNPPMTLGEEYRTAEKYNGNPVYVQAINVGAMPNTTTKRITVVTHSANIQVVDIWGVVKTAGNSQYDFNLAGADLYIEYTGSNPNLAIRTASDMSAQTGIAYLKYTK